MLLAYKAEWEEYKERVLNKPYTPYAAHNFDAYLANRLSTAESKLRKLSYCDEICGDNCPDKGCNCRCHAFKDLMVKEMNIAVQKIQLSRDEEYDDMLEQLNNAT